MPLLRPQPVGVLPLPAGGLLLPDVPGAADLVDRLAVGVLPTDWPAELAFFGRAAKGDVGGALALLAALLAERPRDLLLRFDAFVLDPSPVAYAGLRDDVEGTPLAPLLAAAAFTAGVLDAAPDPAGLDGELRAVVLLTAAAEAVEHGRPELAHGLLVDGVTACREVLPALAAQLLGALAELEPDPADRAARYAEALALLPAGTPTQVRAELSYGRAVALQAAGRPALLREAIRCYQQALVVFRRETHPLLFAEAQANLALCHLATPMVEARDQLRLGIAVQALRDALSVWDREHHPAQWASVTLNLANALQYLPSTHRQDNLVEAVEHYEELLAVRDAAQDPVGVARVLANQGNALAHLGIRDHARTKLVEAQRLFTSVGDDDSARAVGGTLVELAAVATLTEAPA